MAREILIVFISVMLLSSVLGVVMAWPVSMAAKLGCGRRAGLARAFAAFLVQDAGAHLLVFLVNIIVWGLRPPVSNTPESWIGMTIALLLTGWFAYGRLLFPAGDPSCPVKGRIGLTLLGTVVVHAVNVVLLYIFLLSMSQAGLEGVTQ